jgi:hypothetical protein
MSTPSHKGQVSSDAPFKPDVFLYDIFFLCKLFYDQESFLPNVHLKDKYHSVRNCGSLSIA